MKKTLHYTMMSGSSAKRSSCCQLKALWLTDFTGPETDVRPTATAILQTLVDQAIMQTLRTAQKEVHLWTVDDVPTAKGYLQLGADSLTSNRVGWLKQQLCSGPGLRNRTSNRASGHSR